MIGFNIFAPTLLADSMVEDLSKVEVVA